MISGSLSGTKPNSALYFNLGEWAGNEEGLEELTTFVQQVIQNCKESKDDPFTQDKCFTEPFRKVRCHGTRSLGLVPARQNLLVLYEDPRGRVSVR